MALQRSRKTAPVPNPTAEMTEDDADVIVSERRLEEGKRLIPFEEYLREHGLTVERSARPSRSKRAR